MQTWLVRVTFVEPTFDESLNRSSATRFWTWEGPASSSLSASLSAVFEFKRLWVLSSVGWVREIQAVTVVPQHLASPEGGGAHD